MCCNEESVNTELFYTQDACGLSGSAVYAMCERGMKEMKGGSGLKRGTFVVSVMEQSAFDTKLSHVRPMCCTRATLYTL